MERGYSVMVFCEVKVNVDLCKRCSLPSHWLGFVSVSSVCTSYHSPPQGPFRLSQQDLIRVDARAVRMSPTLWTKETAVTLIELYGTTFHFMRYGAIWVNHFYRIIHGLIRLAQIIPSTPSEHCNINHVTRGPATKRENEFSFMQRLITTSIRW